MYYFQKWNTDDWSRHNENKFFQSEQDRSAAENTREEAKQLIQSAMNKTNSTQTEVTERLGERLQNVNLWKFELEKTIRDMVSLFPPIKQFDNFLVSDSGDRAADCGEEAAGVQYPGHRGAAPHRPGLSGQQAEED